MAPERALADTALEHEHRSVFSGENGSENTSMSRQSKPFKHVARPFTWMKIAIHYTPEI